MKTRSTSWMATNARPSAIQLSDTVHLVPSKLLLQKLGQSFHHTSPVWSLDERHDCRELCYDMLTQEVVEDRYRRYGGIARNVFWEPRQPPSLKGALANGNACKCIRAVHDLSRMSTSSHILLHISVDENFHLQHILSLPRDMLAIVFSPRDDG